MLQPLAHLRIVLLGVVWDLTVVPAEGGGDMEKWERGMSFLSE